MKCVGCRGGVGLVDNPWQSAMADSNDDDVDDNVAEHIGSAPEYITRRSPIEIIGSFQCGFLLCFVHFFVLSRESISAFVPTLHYQIG